MTDHPYRNPATMKEKAAQLVEDRRNSTMLGRAQLDLMETGGRYARSSQVVSSTGAPTYPAAADWTQADPGLEPALGYSVEDQEPTGEIHERESIRRADIASPPQRQRDDSASVVAQPNDPGVAEDLDAPPSSRSSAPNIWRRPI